MSGDTMRVRGCAVFRRILLMTAALWKESKCVVECAEVARPWAVADDGRGVRGGEEVSLQGDVLAEGHGDAGKATVLDIVPAVHDALCVVGIDAVASSHVPDCIVDEQGLRRPHRALVRVVWPRGRDVGGDTQGGDIQDLVAAHRHPVAAHGDDDAPDAPKAPNVVAIQRAIPHAAEHEA